DVFVAKISADGLTRVYATYVGGTAADYGLGIAVDGSGNAYVVGQTASPTFPAVNAVQTLSGTNDAFALKLNAAGSAFVYSTYLGGDSLDEATAVAVDSA